MAADIDAGPSAAPVDRGSSAADFLDGPLRAYLDEGPVYEIGADEHAVPDGDQAAILAAHRLQPIADYRGALQRWFGALRMGGYLALVVPHAFLRERQLALPSRSDAAQRRLYTPASLLAEVEEALAPNSYRVRYLSDDDRGYDYAVSSQLDRVGHSDVLLVIERVQMPDWGLQNTVKPKAVAPDYSFEPARTRVETSALPPSQKILILKLDHLGDLILAIPALQKARAAFADAHITLVVGSWNLEIAERLGVADRVLAFDAFPRNSSEEEVDVPAKADLFRALLPERYDLAIDLRTDTDTRLLLKKADAALRAGIGTKSQFPFLDIFLPLDWNRNEPETARDEQLRHQDFSCQGSARRLAHRIVSGASSVERDCAIVWGPYWRLRPGNYIFEPHIELERSRDGGALRMDVALDAQRVAETLLPLPSDERIRLPFTVTKEDAAFEFRIWTVEDLPSLDFSFFGGRLIRQGASSTLHQSEYSSLMIELVRMRVRRFGMLDDVAAWS